MYLTRVASLNLMLCIVSCDMLCTLNVLHVAAGMQVKRSFYQSFYTVISRDVSRLPTELPMLPPAVFDVRKCMKSIAWFVGGPQAEFGYITFLQTLHEAHLPRHKTASVSCQVQTTGVVRLPRHCA
jgi:hypothetical protein